MALAYVQSTQNAAKLVSSLAKAFTSNNAAGNTLLCCVGVWKSTSFTDPTVADTAGNTWKLLLTTPRKFTSGQSCAYLFVAYNCASGPNTVTVTVGSSSDIDFALHEYSGCATVTARDQIAAGSQNAIASILCGTVQTQYANEVLLSFAYDQSHGSQTFTPSAGWTGREQTLNPDNASLRSYDQVVSSTGSFTNTISISGGTSNGLHGIIASFADTSSSDTLVQTGRADGATTSLAVTFPANNAAGNLLVLSIGRWVNGTLGTVSSVTDTQGNTWALIGSTTLITPATHGSSQAHLYACASCAAGANTVTVVTSSSQDIGLIAHEYSSGTLTGFVQNAATAGGGVTSSASGNISVDTGLVVTLAFNQSNILGLYSDVSGIGWKQRANLGMSTSEGLATFDQILGGASVVEQTITTTSGVFGLHVIVAGLFVAAVASDDDTWWRSGTMVYPQFNRLRPLNLDPQEANGVNSPIMIFVIT